MKRIGLSLMALILVASPVISQIINIPQEHTTIQAGINAANDGDTVLVAEGFYLENINFRGKAITVASQFIVDGDTSHISKTIIDGSSPAFPDSASTVTMLLARDTTSVLCGFTIQGGSGTGLFEWILDPLITTRTGGGIIHAGGKIIHNYILNNHVSNTKIVSGGGISGGMVEFIEGDTGLNIVIRNNIISQNSIHSDEHYAGGAGIAMDVNSRFTIIENNTVFENISTTDASYKAFGGGMHLGRLTSSTGKAIIRNNYIHNNEVHSELSFGGGLFYLLLYDSSVKDFHPVEIYNNLIVGNQSDYRGGGACFWYLGIWDSKPPVDPVLTNNTIVDNFAKTGSGLCAIDAEIALINNILWNELADVSGTEISDELFKYCAPMPAWCRDKNSAKFNAVYNNIQGGWPGEENINLNPSFKDESFQLSDRSSCVGSGVDSIQIKDAWYHAPSIDLNENPRPHPIDDRVDIGAIESPYEGYVYIPDTAFLYALIKMGYDINKDGQISYTEADSISDINVSGPEISDLTGIEAFVNLEHLILWELQITSLDLSNNTALVSLICSDNQLTSLDVSKNTALEILECSPNSLTSLDVSKNTALISLGCSRNQLTNLDVLNNTALVSLQCSNNQLTSLDVSNNTALVSLQCSDNQLTRLNLSNNTNLCGDDWRSFGRQKSTKGLTDLISWGRIGLDCSHNQLSSLDVSSNTKLGSLNCGFNQLKSLDLTSNDSLEYLRCANALLTSLNLSNNSALENLGCGNNLLTSLDISRNTALEYLSIDDMTSLRQVCVWETFWSDIYSFERKNIPYRYITTDCIPIVYALDTLYQPQTIEVKSSEDGIVYLVTEDTEGTLQAIRGRCLDSLNVEAYSEVLFSLSEFGNGEYWIYAVDQDNKVSLPKVILIVGVGINNSTANIFQFYPNPTNTLLTIETEYPDHYSFNITTLNGQLIYSTKMEGTTHQIDLSSFKKGIYFITIRSKEFVITRKIIKL